MAGPSLGAWTTPPTPGSSPDTTPPPATARAGCGRSSEAGYPPELWDDALSQLPDSADAIDGFLKKKLGGRTPDRATLKKLSDALLRRGFSWNDIRPALNRLGGEIEE